MSTMTLATAPTTQEAEQLFQSQQWSAAAAAYAALVETDPGVARAWYRLGTARHHLGDYTGAIAALQRAVDLGQQPPAMYNLACAHARAGHTDDALATLEMAVDKGFRFIGLVDTDSDWEPLRTHPRLIELRQRAERLTKPGLHEPHYREFDFWVGDWTVTSSGQSVGDSKIERLADGCIIMENYYQNDGYSGKSINFFDPVLKQWRQTWADSAGHMAEFAGEYHDNALWYMGHWHRYNGTKGVTRMTFFNLDADHVRQLGEETKDDGQTWNTTFDFLYTRKSNS